MTPVTAQGMGDDEKKGGSEAQTAALRRRGLWGRRPQLDEFPTATVANSEIELSLGNPTIKRSPAAANTRFPCM
jgi:hypothetical protein